MELEIGVVPAAEELLAEELIADDVVAGAEEELAEVVAAGAELVDAELGAEVDVDVAEDVEVAPAGVIEAVDTVMPLIALY